MGWVIHQAPCTVPVPTNTCIVFGYMRPPKEKSPSCRQSIVTHHIHRTVQQHIHIASQKTPTATTEQTSKRVGMGKSGAGHDLSLEDDRGDLLANRARGLFWHLGLLDGRDASDEVHLFWLPYLCPLNELVPDPEHEKERDVDV